MISQVYIDHLFIIYFSVDGQLGCFHFLALMIRVAIIMDVQISPQQGMGISGSVPRSGTAGSYGSSIFNLLSNLQTGFRVGCIIAHSH